MDRYENLQKYHKTDRVTGRKNINHNAGANLRSKMRVREWWVNETDGKKDSLYGLARYGMPYLRELWTSFSDAERDVFRLKAEAYNVNLRSQPTKAP